MRSTASSAFLAALLASGAWAAKAPKQPSLGGGYKEAKWGMSVAEVKPAFSGKLEYESKLRDENKFLDYDLGEGRKVRLEFDQDKFYRAVYKPLTQDGDAKTAETVLAGLKKKYGPGESFQGTDGEEKPIVMNEWSDGVSKILFVMPDVTASEWQDNTMKWPKSKVVVTYSSVALEAAFAKRKEERKAKDKAPEPKPSKLEDDL